MATTTWNPSDASVGVTLSGGNLIAQSAAIASGVRGIDGASSGKGYLEYTYTTFNTNNFAVGFGLITANLTGTPNTGLMWVARTSGNIIIQGVTPGPSIGAPVGGTIVGAAVDTVAKLIWFRKSPAGNWNGNASADPATGTLGVDFSALSGAIYPWFKGGSGLADTCTANFGASAFSGTVPSGFTSGWPPISTAGTSNFFFAA